MAIHRPISGRPTGKIPGTPDGQSTPGCWLFVSLSSWLIVVLIKEVVSRPMCVI